MNLSSNNFIVDSFDSADPTASHWQTNQFYHGSNYGFYDPTKRQDSAIVGTEGLLLIVGNANIYGYVDTGPDGTASINPDARSEISPG